MAKKDNTTSIGFEDARWSVISHRVHGDGSPDPFSPDNRTKTYGKRREIRNSTAEFLIFQIEGKEQGVEVYYKDKAVF